MLHGRMAGAGNDARYREATDPGQTWLTPRYIIEPIRKLFGGMIHLDPCTTPENPTGADLFYAPPQDGLAMPWPKSGWQSVFVNPPYGAAKDKWVGKCIDTATFGTEIVLLIPANTAASTFQTAAEFATSLCFVKGRVRTGSKRPNNRHEEWTHPSVLIGYNCDVTKTGLGFGWCK